MKKATLFFALVLNVAIISAQNECLTTAPAPPQWIYNKFAESSLTSLPYTMNIFVHIVRSSSGQGLGTGILSTIISSLNSSFQNTDIQFSLLGSEFIDNDYYYTNLTGRENQLFGVNPNCNAIDIYVLGQSTIWGGAGLAEDIPSTALIVHGNYYATSSLPHEMGHCLGLYHTHHGTVNENGGDTNQCAELVNGSNSSTCGDYISDTSADPNQWSSNSCSYVGTGVDANGDSYNPVSSNLMSYAYKPCRTSYSNLQIGRMKAFIDNTPMLQNTFTSTISGPSTVCSSGSTFTVNNLPTGSTISWDKSSNLILSSTSGSSANFAPTSSGEGWVQATVNSSCGSSIILPRKNVWIGNPSTPTNIIGFYRDGMSFGQDQVYEFSVEPPIIQNVTNYQWVLGGGTILSGQGTSVLTIRTAKNPNGRITYFDLDVRVGNLCGWTSFLSRSGFVVPGVGPINKSGKLILSPNPSSNTVEVTITKDAAYSNSIQSETSAADNESTNYTIRIFNSLSTLVYTTTRTGNNFIIPVNNLRNGNYFIEVTDRKNNYSQQLIIKHD